MKVHGSNMHGYADVEQMALDFAHCVVENCGEPGVPYWVKWLRYTEVEEILAKCNSLTYNRRYHAKKITKRIKGRKHNGYNFWWALVVLPSP